MEDGWKKSGLMTYNHDRGRANRVKDGHKLSNDDIFVPQLSELFSDYKRELERFNPHKVRRIVQKTESKNFQNLNQNISVVHPPKMPKVAFKFNHRTNQMFVYFRNLLLAIYCGH